MRTIALLLGALALIASACGGDDDVEPTVTAEPTADVPVGTATPAPVATPTPLPPSAAALTVLFNPESFVPTVAEFEQLPMTEIELPDGEKVTGVSIGELAARVGAEGATVVTVEGKQIGTDLTGFMRRPVAEVAEGVVIYVTAAGQLMLASPLLPELEWLTSIRNVTFE